MISVPEFGACIYARLSNDTRRETTDWLRLFVRAVRQDVGGAVKRPIHRRIDSAVYSHHDALASRSLLQ